MSRLPLKHPRDSFETDSDIAHMYKHKALQHFASVPTADVNASEEQIMVSNTEKAIVWAVRVFTSWLKEGNSCPVE